MPTTGPKIGVQAMMLKSRVAEQGAYANWQRLADLGFSAVEVSQIELTPETRDQIVRGRDELGIEVAAMSGGMGAAGGGGNDSLVADFDKIVADARALGTTKVRIGMMPMTALENLDTLLAFCHATEAKAKALADEGIALYYHN